MNTKFQLVFRYSERKNRIVSTCMRRDEGDSPADMYENDLGDGIHYDGCNALPTDTEVKLAATLQQWADGNQSVNADWPVRDARDLLNKMHGYRTG